MQHVYIWFISTASDEYSEVYLGLLLGHDVVVLARGAAADGRLARARLPHAAHHQLDQRRLLRTTAVRHVTTRTEREREDEEK